MQSSFVEAFCNALTLNTPPTTNPFPHLVSGFSRRTEQGARGDEQWRINGRHLLYFSLQSAQRDQSESLTGSQADLKHCRGFSDARMNADVTAGMCCAASPRRPDRLTQLDFIHSAQIEFSCWCVWQKGGNGSFQKHLAPE